MKSKPIIAYSLSDTPNWDPLDCQGNLTKPVFTFQEKERLTLYEEGKHVRKIALIEKPDIRPHFQHFLPLIPLYRTSGTVLTTSCFMLYLSY